MVRARSEATKAATSPTSSSVADRRSSVSRSIASAIAPRAGKPSGIDSGTPPVCSVTTRIPRGPSSLASWRRIAFGAWKATCRPPRWWSRIGSPSPPKTRITPEPRRIMWRAAARGVRNVVLTAVTTGRAKSASAIS
jgi:hypothetical protein